MQCCEKDMLNITLFTYWQETRNVLTNKLHTSINPCDQIFIVNPLCNGIYNNSKFFIHVSSICTEYLYCSITVTYNSKFSSAQKCLETNAAVVKRTLYMLVRDRVTNHLRNCGKPYGKSFTCDTLFKYWKSQCNESFRC